MPPVGTTYNVDADQEIDYKGELMKTLNKQEYCIIAAYDLMQMTKLSAANADENQQVFGEHGTRARSHSAFRGHQERPCMYWKKVCFLSAMWVL